jgi:hypothetical protein
MTGRSIASRALVAIAVVVAVAAGVAGYARYELLDAGPFSDRAVQALRDQDVRDLVGREVTDRVVLDAEPDLVAARPLLESLVSGMVGTGAFQAIFRSGVRRVQAALVDDRPGRLALDLRDTVVLVRSALSRLQPRLARRLPDRPIAVPIDDATLARAGAIARAVRRLPYVLGALALALAAAALAVSPRRRGTLQDLGGGLAIASVLALVALAVARGLVVHGPDDALARAALGATWSAFLGSLSSLLIAGAAAGAAIVASASTHGGPPAVEALLARLRALLVDRPRRAAWQLARGVALVVVGALALLDPLGAAKVLAAVGGLLVLYAGLGELLRLLHARLDRADRRAGTTARASRRATLALALPGTVVAALAIVAFGLFLRGGGVRAPEAAAVADAGCNGSPALCDRPLDRVVLPATHNAMSVADEGWYSAEQEDSIGAQLRAGVRGLLIDAHYGVRVPGGVRTDLSERSERAGDADRALYVRALGPEGLAAISRIRDRAIPGRGEPGVYLCHRFCELGATSLDAALESIRDFLVENPDEVLVIVIEDYVRPVDVVDAFRAAGLARMVYRGPPHGPFPTLREMIDADQRVVVYAEHHGGGAPWYTRAYAGAMQETPYTFRRRAQLTDPALLAASCAPNRGGRAGPLLLMNHWVSTDPLPRPSNARAVNAPAALVARARACARVRGRLPDLLAVNFYREGDVFAAARTLNGL